ncbi:MAG: RICIN domain-containing protein [Eubacterium sp.]|nr:RICIN domain-containing protein [Eubacterium sp.]
MRKFLKKMIAFVLSVMLLTGVIEPLTVSAAVTLKSSTIRNYVLAREGQNYPNGYCLRFVEECYQKLGATRPYSCCASQSGNSFLRSESSSNIPVGATVYFGNCGGGPCRSCGSSYFGHVGIYVGDGYFVHATGGKVQKSTISSWANKYRGYGYCGNFNLNQDLSSNTSSSRPTYSNFWLSQKNTSLTEYKLGDTIEVNVEASDYDTLTMGIDKDGVGRVVTKNISSHYTFSSTDLGAGSYSIYVTVSNANGYVDTNRLWFTISAPQYTNFSVSKSVYLLGENVELNVDASNYDGVAVRIDKDGAGRVVSRDVSAHYVFSSNELGEGTYSVYMTVWTNGGQYVDTNRLWFKIAKPLNLGNDFSAMIINAHSQKPIMQNESGNVVLGSESKTNYDRTLWRFVRNSNNTYTIYSYNNNKCLDVQDCSDKAGANVQCWTKQNSSVAWNIAQQWYIFKFSDGTFYLKPVCNAGVLELTNGSEADNTNVHLYTMSDSNAQKFVFKVVDRNKNKLNYSMIANKSTCKTNEKVTVSVAGNVDYVYNYKFHIVSPDGKETVIDNKCNPNYSFSGSCEGKYTIYAEIKNPYYTQSGSKTSKSITINVSCAHNFSPWTTVKKAACTSEGSEQRKCSLCGKIETRTIKASGHKYTDKVIAPTTTKKGYTLHTCEKCGYSYKDNYKDALKKQDDDRITITYDSCGGDLGVKNCGGIKGVTTSVWSEIPKKNYQLTLDPNGGTISKKKISINAPFIAWYTSPGAKGTRYNTGQTVSFKNSMTLYAAYGKASVGNLPSPSRDGYTFEGWYFSNGTKVTSATQISDNCTLTAKWQEEVKETAHVHTPGEWETVREATMTTPGEQVLRCQECGQIMQTEAIPILIVTDTDSKDDTLMDKDIVADDPVTDDTEFDPEGDLTYDSGEDTEEETFSVGDEITTNTEIFTVIKLGDNPCVEYTELFDEDVTDVAIPESITIYGVTYKVTSIAPKAFYKNTSIKSVTLTSSVTKIGSKAFYGCTSLKNIMIFSTKLKSNAIGTNAFTKVAKNVKVYVPSEKYKTYKKILKKAGIGSKAKIYQVTLNR